MTYPVRIALFSPSCQNRLHPIADLLPRDGTIHTSRQ